MRKSEFEANGVAPVAGQISTPTNANTTQHTAGDALIEGIADAVARRLERLQTIRKRLLRVEEAAEYLAMSEDTVERLVANGKLTPVRGLDRRIRFDICDLEKLIDDSKPSKI
jgi:excisionase family DNA binding protein